MIRARFTANNDDWRPIKFPPPAPAWCTGYHGDESGSIVVAYVEREEQITEFWPEASNLDLEYDQEVRFSDRFPQPDWWSPPVTTE